MAWDSVWEDVFKNQEWGKYPGEDLIRFIARNYYKKDRKNTKILEIGCGIGANIWYLAREGFCAYGIDGSKTAIERAKNRLQIENLEANLRLGDIINLPYNDNFFDAVIDIECLYCNSKRDTEIILKEINRVLKKDSLFYGRTFSSEMYMGSSQKEVGYLEYTDISDGPFAGKGFVRLIDEDDIKELYGKYFRIVSIDKLEYTYNNGKIKVSEWIIISQKEE